MKKPTWSFTVRNTADIDIQRILNETPDGEPWVVITDKHGNPVALFIREEFLIKFTGEEAIEVCGEYLNPFWRNIGVPLLLEESGILYSPQTCVLIGRLIGWRVNINKKGEVDRLPSNKITSDDIEALKKAKNLKRIPVRVYVASDC
jgi:hypothetical protein